VSFDMFLAIFLNGNCRSQSVNYVRCSLYNIILLNTFSTFFMKIFNESRCMLLTFVYSINFHITFPKIFHVVPAYCFWIRASLIESSQIWACILWIMSKYHATDHKWASWSGLSRCPVIDPMDTWSVKSSPDALR
jgi:hypothetical protein